MPHDGKGTAIGQAKYINKLLASDSKIPTVPAQWPPTGYPDDKQYAYTANGWNAEPNKEVDQSISGLLTNITADKTVYAAYKKAIRSYQIRWVNADGKDLSGSPVMVQYG